MNFLKGIHFSFCGFSSGVHIFVCFLSITICKKLSFKGHWDLLMIRGLLRKKKGSTKYFASLTEAQELGRLSNSPFNHLSLKIWRVFYLQRAQPTNMGCHVAVLQFLFCGWMVVTTTIEISEPPLCWISLCFKSSGRSTWEVKRTWLLALWSGTLGMSFTVWLVQGRHFPPSWQCKRGLSLDCIPKASLSVKMFCPWEPGFRGLAVAQKQLKGHMLGRHMERVMEMICWRRSVEWVATKGQLCGWPCKSGGGEELISKGARSQQQSCLEYEAEAEKSWWND